MVLNFREKKNLQNCFTADTVQGFHRYFCLLCFNKQALGKANNYNFGKNL